MKHMFILFFALIFQTSYADSSTEQTSQKLSDQRQCADYTSTHYQPVPFEKQGLIIFEDYDNHEPPSDGNFSKGVYQLDCVTGEKTFVNELGFGMIDSAFFEKTDWTTLFFVIQTEWPQSSIEIPYNSKLYFIFAYQAENRRLIFDKTLSDFFNMGGDVRDESEANSYPYKNAYEFPYKTREDIINMLHSPLYQAWRNKEPIEGIVTQPNTMATDNPMYTPLREPWLEGYIPIPEGTPFTVKDIHADYFMIEYTSTDHENTQWWVLCRDTSICESK